MNKLEKSLSCRFNAAIMSDNYIDMICSTLKSVDTKGIYSHTSQIDTVYKGPDETVMNCLKSFIYHVNNHETHITMEATLKPVHDDVCSSIDNIDNTFECEDFNMVSKFSVYIQGIENHQMHIAAIVRVAEHQGLLINVEDNVYILEGKLSDIFDYYSAIVHYAQANLEEWTLQLACSLNSPTSKAVLGSLN